MYLVHSVLKPFLESKGIKILKDDLRFIEDQLSKIPQKAHKEILRNYTKIWLHEVKNNENALQSQNLARRIANKYLRETCIT